MQYSKEGVTNFDPAITVRNIAELGATNYKSAADTVLKIGDVFVQAGNRTADLLLYSLPDSDKSHMAFKLPGIIQGENPDSFYDQVAGLIDGPEGFTEPGMFVRSLREFKKRRFIIDFHPKGLIMPDGTEIKHEVVSHPKSQKYGLLWQHDFSRYSEDPGFRTRHPDRDVEDVVAIDRSLSDADHQNRFLSRPTPDNRSESSYRKGVLNMYTRKRHNLTIIRALDERPLALIAALKQSGGTQGHYEFSSEVSPEARGENITYTCWRDMAEILARKGAQEIEIDITSENKGIRHVIEDLRASPKGYVDWSGMKREMEGSDWSYRVPITRNRQ